jgi:hypothetical protein
LSFFPSFLFWVVRSWVSPPDRSIWSKSVLRANLLSAFVSNPIMMIDFSSISRPTTRITGGVSRPVEAIVVHLLFISF